MDRLEIICIFLGTIFGSLVFLTPFYVIPCVVLYVIAGIKLFELTQKDKFEQNDKIAFLQDEMKKLKTDLETVRTRQNVMGMGQRS